MNDKEDIAKTASVSQSDETGGYTPGWIDIKCKRPENGQEVLVTDGSIITAATCRIYESKELGDICWDGCGFNGYEWDWDWDFKKNSITHWQQLPPLPEGV